VKQHRGEETKAVQYRRQQQGMEGQGVRAAVVGRDVMIDMEGCE
jgi:hypothetical protein